jgi:tripartite-type tricarboxylate transporter receptor subunit TctC
MNRVLNCLLAGLGCVLSSAVFAQSTNLPAGFLGKPVRILLPAAPGGGVDTLARLIGPKLTERWGVPIVADSRPSAGGIAATEALRQSAPDGHTMMLIGSSQMELWAVYYRANWHVTKPGLVPNFDVLKVFDPVVELTSQPYILVVTSKLPVKSLQEFIAYAKARPGELSYATAGVGTPGHLGHEQLHALVGINVTHIPYKGGGASIADLTSGRVQLSFMPSLTGINQIKSGSVRGLGTGGLKRLESLPDLPAIAESVQGFELTNVYGLYVPTQTPPGLVAAINREVTPVLFLPDMKSRFVADGAVPQPAQTPVQIKARIDAGATRWAAIIASSGISPE